MADNPNRLINEKSPYLLQHAFNKVAWWPWCDEAFLEAKSRDCPVFLSIGYSSCHWCHVMEKESFEDPEVAKVLNEAFVCIKVDKEERPDIDALYMSVCQAFTGSGGWPLTILMTPEKYPFFAATYIPKRSGYGRIGLIELTLRILELWGNQRDRLIAPGHQLLTILQEDPETTPKSQPSQELLGLAYLSLESTFDLDFGGFGQAPKFPSPTSLLFLLRYHARTGDEKPLAMVCKTLRAMRLGGIYDQLGFGFHRYATDRAWRIPHFEKMLYDQALLSIAYIEAFTLTKDPTFARSAKETFSYVLSSLTSEEGAFFSAQDADSEGEEGKFYLFEASEIAKALTKNEANFIKETFGIEEWGNFKDPLNQRTTGKNVLAFREPPEELANRLGISLEAFWETLESCRQKLLAIRNGRTPPGTDDKVLLDWNALMIVALAKGAKALDDEGLLQTARAAMGFLWERMRRADGKLYHAYRERPLAVGFLDDYAFLAWALIELYQSSFEVAYLRKAKEVVDLMLELFFDKRSSDFFFVPKGLDDLPARTKRLEDSALPSGSSVAVFDLLWLSRALAEPDYERLAKEALQRAHAWMTHAPHAFTGFLCALDFALGPSSEVILATNDPSSKETRAFLGRLWSVYLPRTSVFLRLTPKGFTDYDIAALTPFREGLKPASENLTAYLCQGGRCEPPTQDIEALIGRIQSPSSL